MNTAKLKIYAPQARRDFIQAVTGRAAFFGLTPNKIEPVVVEGDVALIAGRPFPARVAKQRESLEQRITRQGFDQVMEAMAYTWFNRLVAIRFMELHGYLEHGYRVSKWVVRPAQLAQTNYLETQDDVNAFLDALRRELEDAIASDERIEIR